jgi:hypothetical protein
LPFDPIGLPHSGSVSIEGLDSQVDPTVTDVLAARQEQAGRFREYLASITADDVVRSVDVVENGPSTIGECVGTVFEEEFWHNRYARRDLTLLTGQE